MDLLIITCLFTLLDFKLEYFYKIIAAKNKSKAAISSKITRGVKEVINFLNRTNLKSDKPGLDSKLNNLSKTNIEPIETRKVVAKNLGVSHDIISRVNKILETAKPDEIEK
jgi:hypothetical protein